MDAQHGPTMWQPSPEAAASACPAHTIVARAPSCTNMAHCHVQPVALLVASKVYRRPGLISKLPCANNRKQRQPLTDCRNLAGRIGACRIPCHRSRPARRGTTMRQRSSTRQHPDCCANKPGATRAQAAYSPTNHNHLARCIAKSSQRRSGTM